MIEENLDVLLEWLSRIELGKLYDYFRSQGKTNLELIQNLTEEEIKKVNKINLFHLKKM